MNYPGIAMLATMIVLASAGAMAQQQTKLNKNEVMKAPESVIIKGDAYYITDLGEGNNPVAKDGNGIIWKMNKDGQVSAFAQGNGLDAPKGTAIIGNTLYVADIDQVKGFDLNTGKQVFTADLSATKTQLLNDLAVKDAHTLFVSATDISKIYIVHLGARPGFEELPLTYGVKGANGLIYDSQRQRLYACGFGEANQPNGEIGYIDITAATKTFQPLSTRTGYYDGIALVDHNKALLISDWVAFEKKGVIIRLDLANNQITTVNKAPIAGPADFTIDNKGNIIVPAMIEASIIRLNQD
ncbi:NHL repeat-containing protein [Chitinophaga vietnamensis]|uniref:hypothetical protein n=1 Tax=Chitinophaga vietnamensis TaxID=2593957 RepID=UPI001177446B|nr:hypothetical protein [Chitinophaga vietnamensis]